MTARRVEPPRFVSFIVALSRSRRRRARRLQQKAVILTPVTLPEARELLANEVGLLFRHPMTAFLDHAAFGADRDRLRAVDAMRSERTHPGPGEHWYPQLLPRQFSRLLRHLRDVAVKVQAGAQIGRLAHLNDIALDVFLGYRVGVVGEIAEEMPQIPILASLDEEGRDIHVHVHTQMPVGDAGIDVPGEIEPEERRFDR